MRAGKKRDLKPKQESFCQHYTVHWNATQAAKEAGYSEDSAGKQGYDLLQIPLVLERIKELKEHVLTELGITRERVLTELSRAAFFDLGTAYNPDGTLKTVADMDPETRRAIAGIKVFEEFDGRGATRVKIGETIEVRPYDKVRALELIGKHLKLFAERIEHSGPDGKPIETRANLTDEQLDARIKEMLAKKEPKP